MRTRPANLFRSALVALALLLSSGTLARVAAQQAASAVPADLPSPGAHRDDSASHAGRTVTNPARSTSVPTTRGGMTVDSLVHVARTPITVDWHLLGGGAIPVGTFAAQDGGHPGFARPGFTLGVDYLVGGKSLAWITSVVGSMNPSDNGSTHDVVYISLDLPPTTHVEVGPWYTIWMSSGLQFTFNPSPTIKLQPLLQVGLLAARSSNVDFTLQEDVVTEKVAKFNQASTWATSACGVIGLNWMMTDRFFLSARYMFATPTYDLLITGPRSDFSNHNLYDQPTSLLQMLAGVDF